MTIEIAWNDGKRERIENCQQAWTANGALVIQLSRFADIRYIPLTSIKEWRVIRE